MVDCRPGAGAPPLDLAHPQANGGALTENHHNQAGGSGDMASHGIASPGSVRASTPATTNTHTTYTANAMMSGAGAPPNNGGYPHGVGGSGVGAVGGVAGAAGGCPPYVCGVKGGVVWCGGAGAGAGCPPPHASHVPPPPPPGVNPHVFKSVQPNGSDLPLNDIATLRFYFNQGVDCVYGTYGAPPPRHFSPRELAQVSQVPQVAQVTQELQQVSLQDRPPPHQPDHKHKPNQPNDKPQNNQGKGNGQRPPLGPRFNKRGGGNQEGNHHNNNNPNRHNNNMGNKGPNNRRNSHGDARPPPPAPQMFGAPAAAPEGDFVTDQQPLLTLPYIPYPPPAMYPIPYYHPVDHTDPNMMNMMPGMTYVNYDADGVPYDPSMQAAAAAYYPAHYPPPPPLHHLDHK